MVSPGERGGTHREAFVILAVYDGAVRDEPPRRFDVLYNVERGVAVVVRDVHVAS